MKSLCVVLANACIVANAFSQVSVLTNHNDNMRTGANLNETILDVTNVDSAHFGLLCIRPVDDEVYAQPLVAAAVDVPGYGIRNVLYIATVNNSVYAYDADDRMIVNPFWSINLTPAGTRVPRALDYSQMGVCSGDYRDFSGNIGIVSTPVIDAASHTIYLLSKHIVTLTGEYEQWLHALDIRTGIPKQFSPVKIEASMPGTGDGNVNGVMHFDAKHENQRAGLLLEDGVIYLTWAGYCDWTPYNGWILGYDAQTLQKVVTWSTAPDGMGAGIWMSGAGISTDENGNLYACSGNGTVDPGNPSNPRSRGQSLLKLSRVDSTLQVASFFTPYNYDPLNQLDLDMGSCRVMLIPGTDMALTAGKEGYLYVADRDSMGGVDTLDHVRQTIDLGGVEANGGTVYWKSDSADYVYLWPSFEKPLARWEVDLANGILDTTTKTESTMNNDYKPGGIISLSANGSQPGTGILWANVPLAWPGIGVPNRPAILRAFNAMDITQELWNSEMNPSQDGIENYGKFVPPTIANGRVYMATFGGKVLMYGIYNPDGIDESKSGEDVMVFPNPFSDVISVKLNGSYSKVRFKLCNAIGEIVYATERDSPEIETLDISALSEGIYFLSIETESLNVIRKLIKAN